VQGDNPYEELSVRLAVMLNKMSDLLYCHRSRARGGTMTNIPCRTFMGPSMSITYDRCPPPLTECQRDEEKAREKGRELRRKSETKERHID